jgi:hypothetical protein
MSASQPAPPGAGAETTVVESVDPAVLYVVGAALVIALVFAVFYASRILRGQEEWDKLVFRRECYEILKHALSLTGAVALVSNVFFGFPPASATTKTVGIVFAAYLWGFYAIGDLYEMFFRRARPATPPSGAEPTAPPAAPSAPRDGTN